MERDDASPLMGATVDCLEVNQVLVRWRWWGARGRGRNQAARYACASGLKTSQWIHSRIPSTICRGGKMNVRRGQSCGKIGSYVMVLVGIRAQRSRRRMRDTEER